jgi:ferric-dicitrate binding protein FerR (iron transport regulator)
VGSFVGSVTYSDPATAVAWAASISDPQQRNNRMENSARTWLQQDEAAARAWVQQSTLPDNVKQRLLQKTP